MNKEQLTEEKVREIDSITYQLTRLVEDKRGIQESTNYSIIHSATFSPMDRYNKIIERYGLVDLYEIFRLLLFAALSKQENEYKEKLTSVVNEKQ